MMFGRFLHTQSPFCIYTIVFFERKHTSIDRTNLYDYSAWDFTFLVELFYIAAFLL